MQVVELSRAGYGANISLLMGMHRLRRKVFKDRLDWSVATTGDLEMDRYDTLDATYLVVADRGAVLGCVRLLPTTGPNMLANTFPELSGRRRLLLAPTSSRKAHASASIPN